MYSCTAHRQGQPTYQMEEEKVSPEGAEKKKETTIASPPILPVPHVNRSVRKNEMLKVEANLR